MNRKKNQHPGIEPNGIAVAIASFIAFMQWWCTGLMIFMVDLVDWKMILCGGIQHDLLKQRGI